MINWANLVESVLAGVLCTHLDTADHLNEMPLHILECLNTWSPVIGRVWVGLGSMALLEEVCHRGKSFEVSKAIYHSKILS